MTEPKLDIETERLEYNDMLTAMYEEIERLRPVRAAAQDLLSLGIINPTGSARVEAAKAALAAAVEASFSEPDDADAEEREADEQAQWVAKPLV